MSEIKRSELVFLYDIKDANPNGDPYENKPRIDEETGLNIVTDTRLKRTIRDYLEKFKNKEIFITTARNKEGDLKTREERLEELKINKNNAEELFKKYIDLRLFGATIALKSSNKQEKGSSITRVGPVQFNLGRSLNRVKVETIKGNTVMPSGEQKSQGTFIETSIVHYSLICFHGIINENAAKDTGLTNDDIDLLLEAIWNGTANLITRSKFGQQPRMLLQVVYKDNDYYIGDLHRLLSPKFKDDELAIRDIDQISIDTSKMIKAIEDNKNRIDHVKIKINRLTIEPSIKEKLKSCINIQEFGF